LLSAAIVEILELMWVRCRWLVHLVGIIYQNTSLIVSLLQFFQSKFIEIFHFPCASFLCRTFHHPHEEILLCLQRIRFRLTHGKFNALLEIVNLKGSEYFIIQLHYLTFWQRSFTFKF
jgi:hypothetical protein